MKWDGMEDEVFFVYLFTFALEEEQMGRDGLAFVDALYLGFLKTRTQM